MLGLSTDELAGLTVDELAGNITAIKMMLHYYRQLVDENGVMRNDINTLRTYMSAYETKRSNSATGAILLAISNIPIGFGVNMLTSESPQPPSGWPSIVIGAALIAAGIYFSFIKDRS